MSTFGDDLIQAMTEALAHVKGEGPAIVHDPIAPREVREQGQRRVSGPAATLLRLIQKEPDVVKRALLS
jgi:putative transcriptional regulator